MTRYPVAASAALLAMFALASTACGPSDPKAKILQERARWNVVVLDLSQNDEGTVNISTRVSGPPSSKLRSLSVRVQLTDAEDKVIDRVWHTFDLSGVERGGPADLSIRVPDFPQEVFGAGVDLVLAPTPEEQTHIEELQL
jgi:hypothetical protein